MIIALCVVGWLLCALGTAGIWFADFQSSWPQLANEYRRSDLGMGILMGLISGPIGLIAEFFESGFAKHGWRLK